MEKKIKFGVFGCWRGLSLIQALHPIDQAAVTAICDKDPKRIADAVPFCDEGVKVCANFDELIASGIDAVILSNYFHEHAEYVIRAVNAGVHVLCECLPGVTMKECVEVVEAVEKSGCIFAMAENCPFTEANMELTRLYKSGVLGEVIYAEGEYCHPSSPAEANKYRPNNTTHWRNYLPKTFYHAHSIGPLMVMTDLMPKRVIGKVAAGRAYARSHHREHGDSAGILLVEMEGGALFRVTGTCTYGPQTHWYRLGCEKGGVETVRGTHDQVSLCINPWDLDDSNRSYGTRAVYVPPKNEQTEIAMKAGGHDGADYWTVWNFVQDVLNGRTPYMDVYRSAAIAAVGILGWRSVLEDSKQMDIPDFRDKEARDQYRNDDVSPFPKNGKEPDLPHYVYSL